MFTRCGSRGSGGLGDQSKHGDHRREHRVQNERRVDVRVSGIIERATGESENGEENFQSRMLPDWIYRFDEAARGKRVHSERVANDRERRQWIYRWWETADCYL